MIEIRESTQRDLTFLAETALASARAHTGLGFWDLIKPGPDEDHRRSLVERVLVTGPRSWCHHSNFYVAELDGEPVAAISGYAPDEPGAVRPANVLVEVFDQYGFGESEIAKLSAALAPYLDCAPDEEPGAWVLDWGATRPDARRRGVMGPLVEAALAAGRERGCGFAQIGIYADNAAAARLLERLEFKYADERRSPAFAAALGAPGIVRYRLVL